MVELQSTCEQAMILRTLGYVVMLYLRLIKERPLKKGERLTNFAETNMTNFIAQAEAKGRQEGLADAVLRLLTRKFVDVPEDVRSRVLTTDVEQLDLWIDRILTAGSVEEVFESEAHVG